MSKVYDIVVTCNFGIETVLKREINDLGISIINVEDGRITCKGTMGDIARANLWLRTAGKVYIEMGRFKALSFEDLFQGVKKIKWSELIGENDKFPIKKATSIKSKVFSPSDIQSITKKAIVENLKEVYNVKWFSEDGINYPIYVFINKDNVSILLDTSGDSLYKRGYKVLQTMAPIKETLAAFMILMSPWKWDRTLIDPFCGSGTILIEAAMIGLNIAPGLNREFNFENFSQLDKNEWKEIKKDAYSSIKHDREFKLEGYDIDKEAIKIARKNAETIGVEDYIHFQQRDARDFSTSKKYGFVITNPPYGERLDDEETVKKLYSDMGKVFKPYITWSFYIITSYLQFEKAFNRKANKKRKIYNGMLRSDLYQYFGEKPKFKRVNKK